jgi:gliding motility-associated-like protein
MFDHCSNYNCKDTTIPELVLVHPQTVPDFTINKDSQCTRDNKFVYTNTSTIPYTTIAKSKYNFGDNVTDAGNGLYNSEHRYTLTGKYTVTLFTETFYGCKDTTAKSITTMPQPKPIIVAQSKAICYGVDSFRLQQGGTNNAGSTFQWIVPTVGSKQGSNYSFQFNKYGDYTVRLIETSTFGCVDTVRQLLRSLPNPSARFAITKTDTCLSGNLFKLAQDSVSIYPITQYRWVYSDNTSSALSTPQKHFASIGIHTISLTVKDTNTCTASTTQQIEVYQIPKANFDINTTAQCLKFNNYEFKSKASAGIGNIDSTWYFPSPNDKAKSGTTVTHVYANAGQQSVKMKVMNSKGCVDSLSKTIQVLPDPLVNFSINQSQQCINNQQFDFTNRTIVPGSTGSISYLWNLGDSATSTQTNLSKKYAYYGSKQVLLKATSVAGCWDTASQWIVVQPKPSAKFAINNDTQCVSTNQYNFTNQTTLVSGPWSIKNQAWNFGDGGFGATTSNATKKYNNFGSYSVRLIVTTSFGCADTTYQPVRVHPMPKVSYSVNNANQCLVGNDFQFSNTTSIVSGGGNITYQWKFGNGATTTNTNPSYSYASANTYAVRLIATSQFGCRDSITTNVKAVANPSVNFTINNPTQCATTNQYNFTNTTNANNGSGLTYSWNMGDAAITNSGLNTTFNTASNINHQYNTAGDYRVKLIAVNNIGCTDSVIKTVSVKPVPKPAFDVNQSNQCQKGNQFVFNNQSTVGFAGGSLSSEWIFGDTSKATTATATRTFYQVRSYSVKLIASSSFGCKDSITKFVSVRPMPSASFILNTLQQCLNENRFVTTNTSNISSGNLKYAWNLGDGSGSIVESPSKTYSQYGNYTITLRAISEFNCVDSSKQNITIHSRPIAKFAISDTGQCLYKNEFTYTNQSTNADGSSLTNQWIFGDKTSSTITSPKKSYKTEGDYPIRLAVTSAFGCTDSSSSLVRVYPQPAPNFIINNPGQCLTNNYFIASNYSYIGTRGGSLSYKWTFGDGRTRDSVSPSWIYAKDDTFQVKLVVTSSLGCKDSASTRVVVYPQPKVAFTIPTPTQCFNGNKYEFQNNSTITSGILSYLWTFGNGISSSNPSPVLGYPDFGDYNVELFVRSTFGCQDSLTKTVRINPSPKADFVVNKDLQCERGNNFKIINFSSVAEGTNAYLWNFGDGKQSVVAQPNYTYAQYGEYKVKMLVTTDKGCTDSQQTKFVVKPNPDADFTINDTSQCAEQNDYIFLNNSKIVQGRFNSQWDLGDKNALLGLHARNTYQKQGTYFVKLKVSSAWGCSDSIIKPIYVRNQPIVEYTMDKTGACERENIFATNNLSRVNDDTLYHRWEMGDGAQYNVKNTTHKYQKSGDYRIRLIVFSNFGCSDSLDTKVTVFPQGKSNVTIYDTAVCFRNNQVTMGNFSRVDKDLFLFQSWNFGDGKIDTTLTVVPRTYSYPDTGNYKVTLITTTQNFCTDTSFDFITVKPMPVVQIGSSAPSYCLNQQNFQFQSLTSGVPDQIINNWSFGDGIYETGEQVNHLYRLPGSYKVQLVSTSTFGCSDTAIYPVRVNALPIASFTVNNLEQCLQNSSEFTGTETNKYRFIDISQNTGANIFRFWRLGDGSLDSKDTVNYSYATAGLFDVELVLLDANGCSDTATKTVTVHPTPEASIAVAPVCLGEFNEFKSNATIASGSITNWRWNFGDGSVSGDVDPKYRYTQPTFYVVSLKVTSDKGCFNEYKDAARVYPKPVAKILTPQRLVSKSTSDSSYEDGLATINNPEYKFMDQDQSADVSYEWDFGDGTDFSNEMTPSHRFGDTGTFTVSLTLTNADGCSEFDQLDAQILSDHLILLPSAFSPNNDSHNDTYKPLGRFHSIRDYQITIHDANGLLVYQSSDIWQEWNGKWNNIGEDAPAGMYEVSIAFIDVFQQKHVYNKRVTLVR